MKLFRNTLTGLYNRDNVSPTPLQEHDCRLTRDIVELIDREADLIMRGIPDPSLGGNLTP